MQKLKTLFALFFLLFAVQAKADDNSKRIQELKYTILDTAFSAQGTYDGDDNSLEVRQKLDPLIDELISLAPPRTEQQKLIDVIGTWYQVWSDSPITSPTGTGALGDSIWQIVFPEGYYWNVLRNKNGAEESMHYLRGQFTTNDSSWGFTLNKAVFNPQWSFSEPTRLAMLAEFGAFDANPIPYPPETTPIGKTGTLANVYVDEDIRICRSTGGTDPSTGVSLYIYERD